MRLSVALMMVSTFALFGCQTPGDRPIEDAPADPSIHYGESRPLGDGTIRTWVRLDDDGNPTAVGVTLTEAALRNLPTTDAEACCGTEYALALPPEAAHTAFSHAAVNWNSHGHEPAGIYDKPHFDVHFYLIDPKVRAAITGEGDDRPRFLKAPATQCVPKDYVMVPIVVPRMGCHFADMTSAEFRGQPFTTTFLYGYYDGELAFVEPMLTKAFLETKPDFQQEIKLPETFTRCGCYYPTSYSVRWDARAKAYNIALEGLVAR